MEYRLIQYVPAQYLISQYFGHIWSQTLSSF